MTIKYSETAFSVLDEASVRYCIFKSSAALTQGLQGTQDLDILVRREDYSGFCAILHEVGAFRAVPHAMLFTPEREDWFVPLQDRAGYLHLDVHTRVLLGGKFAKRYGGFEYEDVESFVLHEASPPCVSAMDECRITLARIAFRQTGWPWQHSVSLTGGWRDEVRDLVFAELRRGQAEVAYPPRLGGVRLRLARTTQGIAVGRAGLLELRRQILKANGAQGLAGSVNNILSMSRGLRYKLVRMIERLFPGSVVSRRHPVTGGIVIALVAPDGLGKSTQVKQLRKIFGWKFCVTTEYLGTGDGGGWPLRRFIRTIYIRQKMSRQRNQRDKQTLAGAEHGQAGLFKSFFRAAWGVMVAMERLKKLQRAVRARRRGFIVFCDRWPQSIRPGIMDGPVEHGSADQPRLVRWLIGYELRLYQAMQAFRPDLTIHMVAAHDISAARKPGEIDKPDFDARLDVMARLRAEDPSIVCVDASQMQDQVTDDLFRAIWKKL